MSKPVTSNQQAKYEQAMRASDWKYALAPLMVSSWPQAILHVDCDAFFASCEQALHPRLQGKPVVTGKERGIVAAASYEAKARGVKRGMRLYEVQKVCPDAVILPSDYETYSLFSVRMFEILRRFSPAVEEYSIDEAFVDLSGLRRPLHSSYPEIGANIQDVISRELGVSVSVGISLSKVLAKLASKHRKPGGLTVVPGRKLHHYLALKSIDDIWGIGGNTAAYLRKFGIESAYQFARRDEAFVKRHFSKPYREIWSELNGHSIYPLETIPRSSYKSICKAKTFTPPSCDAAFIFAQLARNLENACGKARRHTLEARRVVIYLRTQDYQDSAVELCLTRPSAFPADIIPIMRQGFSRLFRRRTAYRSTGVILTHLKASQSAQLGLFDDPVRLENMTRLYSAVDRMSERFGKHTVMLAATLPTKLQAQHEGERGDEPWRKSATLYGENARQRLGLLMLDVEV